MSDPLDCKPTADDLAAEEKQLEKFGLQFELSRRGFMQAASVISVAAAAGFPVSSMALDSTFPAKQSVTLQVNGVAQTIEIDPRTSLLDVLRDRLDLIGTKKGCDHGQCGACTVLLGHRRVNSCLTLAMAVEGAEITTIEGLAKVSDPKDVSELHPVQAAFLEHDGYQCGYCTPGQICSAVAALEEQKQGALSIVSFDTGKTEHPELTDDEIRERMSGNICRCGAYPNIVAAVRAASQGVSA